MANIIPCLFRFLLQKTATKIKNYNYLLKTNLIPYFYFEFFNKTGINL